MISIKRIFFLTLALTAAINSFGFFDKTLTIKVSQFKDSDNYSLNVVNKNTTHIVVKISNNKDEIIFSEMIQNVEQFYKVYNLSTLPKGKYKMLINNNNEEESFDITINQLKGTHPDLGNHMVVGFSKVKDRQVSAFIQNKHKNDVLVKLYNNLGREINTIATTNDSISKQQLDLSSLKPGNYKLKITDDQSIFSIDLVLK